MARVALISDNREITDSLKEVLETEAYGVGSITVNDIRNGSIDFCGVNHLAKGTG